MKHSQENRRYKRFEVEGLYGSMLSAHDVSIVNINMFGMALKTMNRLDIGRGYSLKIRHGSVSVLVKGVVVWCILSGSCTLPNGEHAPVYTAGVKFMENRDQKYEALRNFIEETRLESVESRVSGVRFTPTGERTAELGAPITFNVKKLSRSGMLAECSETLQVESLLDVKLEIDSKPVQVQCRVVNTNPLPGSAFIFVGMEFLKFRRDGKTVLDGFIDELERLHHSE
ncbi:MAG: PilZ domain-containing protein [Nitrospirae bacterium]|nr:PilZ domain-containing protein [Nitrospirota bacterium]